MKKIAIVLYGNIRYDGRVQKEIKTLIKNKYNVTLFISKFDKDDKKENYNFKIEVIEDLLNKKGTIENFINLLNFKKKIIKKIRDEKFDYIHCNDLNTLFFSKITSKYGKIVFDAHELFPESNEKKIKKFLWNLIEKKNIKYIYKVIQPEINRKKYFSKKYRLKEKKIELIENFPLNLSNELKKGYFFEKYNYKTEKKIALYIGAIMQKRGILEILESLKNNKEIIFFCIGKCLDKNYKEKLYSFIKDNKMEDRVFFKESIPQAEVLEATNSADISFIFYKNINLNNYYCASNKLYECLNCGVKILTNNYPGIISVTKEIPNVYNIKSINVKELKKGIEYLLNITEVKKTEFYWENQEEKFINIYK